MNTEQNAVQTAEKAANYSVEQVQMLRDAAPIDMEKAKILAEKMGKTYRSIIAKAKREQIPYLAKVPEPKKGKDAPTKAELVGAMRIVTGLKLPDLDKASTAALNELAHWINEKMRPVQSE